MIKGCSIFLFFCRLAGNGFERVEKREYNREEECVSYESIDHDGDKTGCAGRPFTR